MDITLSERRGIEPEEIINLYQANKWSAADKPVELCKALSNSHSLITAWDNERLVGLGNAISDGHLVVYYPHLLVHSDYQRKGMGKMIMDKMQEKYGSFHMQMLTADGGATEFYKKLDFLVQVTQKLFGSVKVYIQLFPSDPVFVTDPGLRYTFSDTQAKSPPNAGYKIDERQKIE